MQGAAWGTASKRASIGQGVAVTAALTWRLLMCLMLWILGDMLYAPNLLTDAQVGRKGGPKVGGHLGRGGCVRGTSSCIWERGGVTRVSVMLPTGWGVMVTAESTWRARLAHTTWIWVMCCMHQTCWLTHKWVWLSLEGLCAFHGLAEGPRVSIGATPACSSSAYIKLQQYVSVCPLPPHGGPRTLEYLLIFFVTPPHFPCVSPPAGSSGDMGVAAGPPLTSKPRLRRMHQPA